MADSCHSSKRHINECKAYERHSYECHSDEYHSDECHSVECHSVECCGAFEHILQIKIVYNLFFIFTSRL